MKDNRFTFWIACIVSLGGILYGYDLGIISGALLFIQRTISMTDMQTGLVVGAVLGGALFGTVFAGVVADWYGRRILIILASLIFIIGVALVLVAYSFWMIFWARTFLGIGVGVVSVGVPLYVAEMMPAKDRGRYMTYFQLLLTFGIVVAYIVGFLFTASGNWRAMFAMVLIPALGLLIGMLFLPETPRWLITQGNMNAAYDILKRMQIPETVIAAEMQTMQYSLHGVNGGWYELFSPTLWLITLTATAIAICNQLTGINAFLQYAPLMLQKTGMNSNQIAMMGTVGIGMLNFIATIFSMLCVDTLGRRPLLLTGIFGVFVAELLMSIIAASANEYTALLSLILMFAFIVFYAIGPGVVVWLAISELFPTRLRGKGMALCLFLNSLTATVISTVFLSVINTISLSKTYLICALFSSIYFIIAYFLLPETKAKTLEEIQFECAK